MIFRSARQKVAALLIAAASAVWAFTQLGPLSRPVPVQAFADKKADGAELFATRGCTHCHGDNGQGTDRAPGLRNLRKKLHEDKIRDQIVHGGEGMPAFGDSLKPEEVDDLVAFLRAKTWITPPPQPKEAPAAPAGNAGSPS